MQPGGAGCSGGGGGDGGFAGSDGSAADLTIRVGERQFQAHRGVLSTCCDYSRQRLGCDSGFVDGRASELELPDADLDTFAVVLRWLYTRGADIPAEAARGVAELADRLLLQELCAAAVDVMASSVTIETVVNMLTWIHDLCEVRGGGDGFGALLERLRGCYVARWDWLSEDVVDGLCQAAETRPDLQTWTCAAEEGFNGFHARWRRGCPLEWADA